jgi:Flp pilus assembly protein TadG
MLTGLSPRPRHSFPGFSLRSHRNALALALAEHRSVAAMEFALVAPILITLTLATYDLARALLVWQQINNAAEAIAEAAEKIAANNSSQLTAAQMQNAMSTIYAEVPGLALGKGTGNFPGQYMVTLSEVVYLPFCTTATPSAANCTTTGYSLGTAGGATNVQLPYTLWSSYLTEGGPSLMTGSAALLRPCKAGGSTDSALTSVAAFPDASNELSVMVNADMAGAQPDVALPAVTMTPQVVADVQYVFTPSFPLYSLLAKNGFTLWASATMPVPTGGLTQEITYTGTGGADDGTTNPEVCTLIPSPSSS